MILTRKVVNFTRKDVMRGEEFVGLTAQKQIDGMLRTVTSTIKVGGEYQIAEVTNPTIDYMVTRNIEKFRGRVALYVKNPPPRTNNIEILSYTDYDPFGSPMADRRFVPAKPYRFGYQGQFAEDEGDENGYNSFEARMYDSKIGRWTTIDPAKQFWSPYLAMGNNWPNVIDKEGDLAWFIPGLVGGAVAIGFNISAQVQEGTFSLTSGKSWSRMTVAGTTGFGLAYTPGGWAGIATVGAACGTSNIFDQAIKNGGFDNIKGTEVAASAAGGVIGYKVGGAIGNHFKPGTMGGSLLINNFGVNFRDQAVKNAIKSATEAAGGLTGGYSAMWLNNSLNWDFGDDLIRGTTPWGQNYVIQPGQAVELPGAIVIAPKP